MPFRTPGGEQRSPGQETRTYSFFLQRIVASHRTPAPHAPSGTLAGEDMRSHEARGAAKNHLQTQTGGVTSISDGKHDSGPPDGNGRLPTPSSVSALDAVTCAAAHALSAFVEPPAEEYEGPKHNQSFHSTTFRCRGAQMAAVPGPVERPRLVLRLSRHYSATAATSSPVSSPWNFSQEA